MKSKKFDCVRMAREIRDKLHEEQKDMTDDEKIAHYHQKAVEARRLREKGAKYGSS